MSLERIEGAVKRGSDSTRRQAQAQRTRADVLEAAHGLLLERGYAVTSMADVAAAAAVSVETVYKAFGNKAGLVRAVAERAMEGAGPIPAETRSDALQALERDPRALLRGWGLLTAEVAPRIAPILLLVRAGAAHDAELASLADQLAASRHQRMADNARRLDERGHLRTTVDVGEATDVLWTYSSPELYELLVLRRGWDLERYSGFVTDGLVAHLLPIPDSDPRPSWVRVSDERQVRPEHTQARSRLSP